MGHGHPLLLMLLLPLSSPPLSLSVSKSLSQTKFCPLRCTNGYTNTHISLSHYSQTPSSHFSLSHTHILPPAFTPSPMDTQIQRSNSSSGVHVCRQCGWPFPKPHPSSRHRRAHKKVCGSIQGYTRVAYGDEVASDDDSKGETLTDGSKSVEKSTRRGGSEEEMFADAVTEFAEVNVAIADAGNLYPPSSANGAQVLTPEREATLDCNSEEVADEKRFGLDGKTDSSEKSFRATGDTNEETGRRLETFTSCNDSFQNVVETDYLLLRENSAVVLEGCEGQSTEIGETKGEEAHRNVTLTDANARNFLDDIDSLAKSMKGFMPAGEYVECDHKEELTLKCENFSAVEKPSEFSWIGHAEEERKFEHEFPEFLLESKDAIHVENVLKNLQESEAGNNTISGTDDNVDSTQSLAITEGDLDQGKQEETVAAVGIQVDSGLIEEKGHNFGFVDGDTNLVNENLYESALGTQVDSSESEDTVLVENNVQKSLPESEAGNDAISGTDDNVDSTQSLAITEERDLDQGKQEETVAGSNSETHSVDERKLEDELPIASLESKDTIPVENNVLKNLPESEAANNAISGTAGNVDSTQSLAITEEGDLDQGKREETVAVLGIQVEENEGMISGLTDGDVNHMKEEETVSGSSDGDGNLVRREETATVSALDVQADASSQTNSVEGNSGSVSAATETESRPPQAPAKVQTPVFPPGSDNDKQETSLFKPNEDGSGRNQGPTEAQTPQIPPGSKNNEEIGAEKRHMPLKSFLGDESSPPRKTPAKEAGQEWNSPARYPTNIKREKRKGKSRAWVPFICCSSSAQAS